MNQDGPNYNPKIAEQALARTKEIFKWDIDKNMKRLLFMIG